MVIRFASASTPAHNGLENYVPNSAREGIVIRPDSYNISSRRLRHQIRMEEARTTLRFLERHAQQIDPLELVYD